MSILGLFPRLLHQYHKDVYQWLNKEFVIGTYLFQVLSDRRLAIAARKAWSILVYKVNPSAIYVELK